MVLIPSVSGLCILFTPFGKELLIRLIVCSLCIVFSHFGFKGGTVVLIAPVPGHCLPLLFIPKQHSMNDPH